MTRSSTLPTENARGWVDSVEEVDQKIRAAGGRHVTGRKETGPNVYYEVKYATPEGFIFDVTESGWKGAVKDVVPAKTQDAA